MIPAGFLQLIFVLLAVGVLLWAIPRLPIDAAIGGMIRVLVVVLAAFWVLWITFGLLGGLSGTGLRPHVYR